MPRVKKYLKSVIQALQGLFFTLHILGCFSLKTAQGTTLDSNPSCSWAEKLFMSHDFYSSEILSAVSCTDLYGRLNRQLQRHVVCVLR